MDERVQDGVCIQAGETLKEARLLCGHPGPQSDVRDVFVSAPLECQLACCLLLERGFLFLRLSISCVFPGDVSQNLPCQLVRKQDASVESDKTHITCCAQQTLSHSFIHFYDL